MLDKNIQHHYQVYLLAGFLWDKIMDAYPHLEQLKLIRRRYYKTLGTSEINSPLSPFSLLINTINFTINKYGGYNYNQKMNNYLIAACSAVSGTTGTGVSRHIYIDR